MLQGTVRWNGLERVQIGPVANNKDIVAVEATPGYGQVPVASIGGHDDVATVVGQLLEPNLDLIKKSLLTVLRLIELRAGIVLVENVFHSQEFERQGNQENSVGGVAALQDMNPAPQVNPPRVEKLPKQRAAVLAQIPVEAVSFFGHRVPVDMNSFDHLVPFLEAFASGTQHGYFVPVVLQ
jgi:hypothetical protein